MSFLAPLWVRIIKKKIKIHEKLSKAKSTRCFVKMQTRFAVATSAAKCSILNWGNGKRGANQVSSKR